MAAFDVKVNGAEFLENQLLALERNVGKKIVRKAVRAGAKVVLASTKNAASFMVGGEMGGLLSKNIITRAFKKQRRGQFGVGTRTRSESEGSPQEFIHISQDGTRQYIPAAIEFGHVDRAGGHVPAIPFMRTAFDATKSESQRIVERELFNGILAAAKAAKGK